MKAIDCGMSYKNYRIDLGYPEKEPNFKEIIAAFAEVGLNVTEEGLRFNYSCWMSDLKSGYRDEDNGVHIFTPCKCNELSFNVSELLDNAHWQKTYMC